MAEKTRTCPYCKEEIKPDATRCKYCRSQLQAVEPSHGGTCPYCKEAIHPEAIKCRHCGAVVGPGSCEGCGGAETPSAAGAAPAGFMPTMSGPPDN